MSSQTFPTQFISDSEVVRFDVWFYEATTRSWVDLSQFLHLQTTFKKKKKENGSLVWQGALHNTLNFTLNGNICKNSNWMSITVQSISLCHRPILPRASPTSVSVKLLTPCQQRRSTYLDPVDGLVLVDLSHANVFSESAEWGVTHVCLFPSATHPHTHARAHIIRIPGLGRVLPLSLSPIDTQHLQFRNKLAELWPSPPLDEGNQIGDFSPGNGRLDPDPLRSFVAFPWHHVSLTDK